MKSIIPACLLMLIECSLSFAATDCRTQEYSDRTEVVCIGDEKAGPETNQPAKSAQVKIAANLAQNQLQSPPQTPQTQVFTESTPQNAAPSAEASQQTAAPSSKPDTAAGHLDKRRGLATRNTRNLMNYSSAQTLQGQ